MDASLLNPSRFLKSQAFAGREPTFTIRAVRIEELEDTQGGKKAKGIMSFVETPKELVLNRTNVEAFKALWGRETDDWIGKRVTLFAAPFHDNTTGEDTTCIRVRGSPDIERATTATIALPRKKPFAWPLAKTPVNPPAGNGKPAASKPNGKQAASSAPPPAPSSPPPPMTEEEKAAAVAAEHQQATSY